MLNLCQGAASNPFSEFAFPVSFIRVLQLPTCYTADGSRDWHLITRSGTSGADMRNASIIRHLRSARLLQIFRAPTPRSVCKASRHLTCVESASPSAPRATNITDVTTESSNSRNLEVARIRSIGIPLLGQRRQRGLAQVSCKRRE